MPLATWVCTLLPVVSMTTVDKDVREDEEIVGKLVGLVVVNITVVPGKNQNNLY